MNGGHVEKAGMRTAFGCIHDAPEYTGRSIAIERSSPNTRLRKGSVIKIPAGEDIVSSPAGVFMRGNTVILIYHVLSQIS